MRGHQKDKSYLIDQNEEIYSCSFVQIYKERPFVNKIKRGIASNPI